MQKKHERSIHVDLRQSFGFFRPTLTELGPLNLRLSLGLEPECFNDIVNEALGELNTLLGSYTEYPEKASSLKSKTAKQLTQTPLTAEYQLKQKSSVKEAFEGYISGHIAKSKASKSALQLAKETPVVRRNRPEAKNKPNKDATILFKLLEKTVFYAINKVCTEAKAINEEGPLEQLKHNYWHSLKNLYQHCDEAQNFLNALDTYGETYAYMLANNYLEKILEYLVSLNSLLDIQRSMKGEKVKTVIERLTTTEESYVARTFNADAELVDAYFTDSGQQAIVASVLAMDLQLYPMGGIHDHSLYTFEESYYEFEGFLKTSGGLRIPKRMNDLKQRQIAKIAFVDITRVELVNFSEMKNLRALVIDVSRDPNMDEPKLKTKITAARKKGLWVILAGSCLKHEELGLDKYQAGKVVTIAPSVEATNSAGIISKELTAVANEAMREPAVASYLQMTNEIYGDKLPMEVPKKSGGGHEGKHYNFS